MALQHTVMQLRKICNHPLLFDTAATSFGTKETLVEGCGKFQLMDKLLPALIDRGHRVLIFSQMTRILDILEEYLETKGLSWCRIDGAIKQSDRQADIDRFNKDTSVKVFLLSTRAGGLGINLTAADTVILYDSDWVCSSICLHKHLLMNPSRILKWIFKRRTACIGLVKRSPF